MPRGAILAPTRHWAAHPKHSDRTQRTVVSPLGVPTPLPGLFCAHASYRAQLNLCEKHIWNTERIVILGGSTAPATHQREAGKLGGSLPLLAYRQGSLTTGPRTSAHPGWQEVTSGPGRKAESQAPPCTYSWFESAASSPGNLHRKGGTGGGSPAPLAFTAPETEVSAVLSSSLSSGLVWQYSKLSH